MSVVNNIVEFGSAHPQALVVLAVTTFVTSLGSAVLSLVGWYLSVRRWERVEQRQAAQHIRTERSESRCAQRHQIQDAEWQKAYARNAEQLHTMALDVNALKTYRRNQSVRLAELEDLVDLLNADGGNVVYDLESTQPLPRITARPRSN